MAKDGRTVLDGSSSCTRRSTGHRSCVRIFLLKVSNKKEKIQTHVNASKSRCYSRRIRTDSYLEHSHLPMLVEPTTTIKCLPSSKWWLIHCHIRWWCFSRSSWLGAHLPLCHPKHVEEYLSLLLPHTHTHGMPSLLIPCEWFQYQKQKSCWTRPCP